MDIFSSSSPSFFFPPLFSSALSLSLSHTLSLAHLGLFFLHLGGGGGVDGAGKRKRPRTPVRLSRSGCNQGATGGAKWKRRMARSAPPTTRDPVKD
jgi:hypothetical protein